MKDAIERSILIDAPRAAVWKALVDAGEFGAWFRCRFHGSFVVGERLAAEMTGYGMEGMTFWIVPVEIVPPGRFAFDWPAGEEETGADAPTTRVTFVLTEEDDGTLVRVTETGFTDLPEEIAARKYPENVHGWELQLGNIKTHVEG